MSECYNCRKDFDDGKFWCKDCGNYFCFKCSFKSGSCVLPYVCDGCLGNKTIRDAIDGNEHWKISNEELIEYLLDKLYLTKEQALRHCLVYRLTNKE